MHIHCMEPGAHALDCCFLYKLFHHVYLFTLFYFCRMLSMV